MMVVIDNPILPHSRRTMPKLAKGRGKNCRQKQIGFWTFLLMVAGSSCTILPRARKRRKVSHKEHTDMRERTKKGRRKEPQRDEGSRTMPKEKVVEEGLQPNPGPQQQSEETEEVTMECVNIMSMEKNIHALMGRAVKNGLTAFQEHKMKPKDIKRIKDIQKGKAHDGMQPVRPKHRNAKCRSWHVGTSKNHVCRGRKKGQMHEKKHTRQEEQTSTA